jgi:hypothetical protein
MSLIYLHIGSADKKIMKKKKKSDGRLRTHCLFREVPLYDGEERVFNKIKSHLLKYGRIFEPHFENMQNKFADFVFRFSSERES